METQLLREQDIFPSEEVLKNTLGSIYPVYKLLMESITNAGYGLTCEWHYYKDGKSWLCKVINKKKTVFWLSVWEGYFKTSFFFVERHLEGIMALNIDNTHFTLEKEWGKMIPLIFNISKKEQLADLLKVAAFKKALK
jgi:hypothetical protein